MAVFSTIGHRFLDSVFLWVLGCFPLLLSPEFYAMTADCARNKLQSPYFGDLCNLQLASDISYLISHISVQMDFSNCDYARTVPGLFILHESASLSGLTPGFIKLCPEIGFATEKCLL